MRSAIADVKLFEASRHGDVEAFRLVVERYQNLVCAVSFSATGDRALSEDVTQETFLAAWRSLDEVREPSKLRSWLCGIARNLSSKAIRRRREIPDADGIDNAAAHGSPYDDVLERQNEQVVWEALEKIPANYREPLVLYYQHECSVREVAEALELSEAAVQQRLSRGRRYLKDGVTAIVERALTQSKPRAGLSVAVIAAITAAGAGVANASSGASSAASASTRAAPTTGASSMTTLKIAIAAAALTAAGGITYVAVHDGSANEAAAAPSRSVADRREGTTAPVGETNSPSGAGPNATHAAPATAHRHRGDDRALSADNHHNLSLEISGIDHEIAHEAAKMKLHECFASLHHVGDNSAGEWSVVTDLTLSAGKVTSASIVEVGSGDLDRRAAEACVVAALSETIFGGFSSSLQMRLSAKLDGTPPPDAELYRALGVEQGQSRGAAEGAAVSLVVFTDFGCRFCGVAVGTLDELIEAYPDELRVVVKHFPVRGDESMLAARAASAAANQGKFWPMHDALFANQDNLSREGITALATELGLDMTTFVADLDAEATRQQVEAERDEGYSLGVQATPTFLVNGNRVTGARPVEHFRALIDAELAAP